LLAAIPNVTHAGEMEVAPIDLQFEVSEERIGWMAIPNGHPKWGKGNSREKGNVNNVGSIGPEFTVRFQINYGASLWLTQMELETISKEHTSALQYEFVSQKLSSNIYQIGGNTSAMYILYAVSEEDARKMAVAYINKLNEKNHKRLEGDKRKLEEYRSTVPEQEKMLAAHKEKRYKLVKRFEELKKETGLSNLEEAAEIRKGYLVKLRHL
jgi:hypothetical protein